MSAAFIRPAVTDRRYKCLIPRTRDCENHATIDERNRVQEAPAENAPRAPVNLIAKHVRDRNPKQSGHNQQISKYRNESRLVS